MNTPSNIRTILIERTSLNDKGNYLKISKNNLRLASFNLSGNALKLYLYLCANTNHWKVFLFSSDFYNNFANITEKTYRKVFNELVTKGYLVQINPDYQKNTYIFKEVSDNEEIQNPKNNEEDVLQVVDKKEMEEYWKNILQE